MSNKNTKKEIIVSPVGTAGWACVTKPSTKFDADGLYSLDLIVSKEAGQSLSERLKAAAVESKKNFLANEKDAKKKAAIQKFEISVPVAPEVDDEGNETDNVVFKFKAKAKIKPKNKEAFEKRIAIFDAKKNPIVGKIVGRGSTVKAAFEIVPYCMAATKKAGVTLRLSAVQVINLVEPQAGGNADSYGFGEEEGYDGGGSAFNEETPSSDAPAPSESDAAPTEGSEGGDF